MFAGFQIVEIKAVRNVLFFGVIEVFFEFPALKQLADGRHPRFPFKLLFAEQEMCDFFQGQSCFVCLRNRRNIVGISPRECKFLSVESNPFTERFIFCNLFKQGTVFGVCAQTEF